MCRKSSGEARAGKARVVVERAERTRGNTMPTLENARPQVRCFREPFARTGLRRLRIREHRTAAKTKQKSGIAGRSGGSRFPAWGDRAVDGRDGMLRLRHSDRSVFGDHDQHIGAQLVRGALGAIRASLFETTHSSYASVGSKKFLVSALRGQKRKKASNLACQIDRTIGILTR